MQLTSKLFVCITNYLAHNVHNILLWGQQNYAQNHNQSHVRI